MASEYYIKRFISAMQATNWNFIYECPNPNDAYNKLIIHDINRKNKIYKRLKVQGDNSLEIHYKKFENNL